MLITYVADKKITSSSQLDTALAYLKKKSGVTSLDTEDFNKSIGVGVNYTDEDINKIISELIEKNRAELVSERYLVDLGGLLR